MIQEEPRPTDQDLDALWDEEARYYALYERARRFGRAVLEKWAMTEQHPIAPPPELVQQWRTPRPVSDVFLAFPASVIGCYIPTWEELPMPFQEFTSGYEELASYACFHPVELRPEVLIKGIEADSATRQLSAVARSFEPKHEHKQAAMAFLLSLWLKPEVQS